MKWASEQALDKWPDDILAHSANPVGSKNMRLYIRNVHTHLLSR